MSNHRIERVGMEIKREVNEILQKKVRDPRVQGVTITDVQMSGDLSLAKVYYTIMSDLASDNQKVQIGLEKAKGTIKRELGKNLTMYKIPDLTFIKDESIEYGNKIDQMLRDLEKRNQVNKKVSSVCLLIAVKVRKQVSSLRQDYKSNEGFFHQPKNDYFRSRPVYTL